MFFKFSIFFLKKLKFFILRAMQGTFLVISKFILICVAFSLKLTLLKQCHQQFSNKRISTFIITKKQLFSENSCNVKNLCKPRSNTKSYTLNFQWRESWAWYKFIMILILVNPIRAGRGVNLIPPPVVFFYITQKVLVWGC